MGILAARSSVCPSCVQWPQRPEEGVSFLGTVRRTMNSGNKTWVLCKKPLLFTAEPSLQSHDHQRRLNNNKYTTENNSLSRLVAWQRTRLTSLPPTHKLLA